MRSSAGLSSAAATGTLLAASLQPSALFSFPLDASLQPPSPLSSRACLSRQIFAQPLSTQSGSAAPPNTPPTSAPLVDAAAAAAANSSPAARCPLLSDYQAALLPAGGFGHDMAVNFEQLAVGDQHQQLLRYLAERQTTAWAPPLLQQPYPLHQPLLPLQPHAVLQSGQSAVGNGGSGVLKPLLSVFGAMSSLPPPLSRPPLPLLFPADLSPSPPRSPSERTSHSTSTSATALCQSPSSTLSSSSYMSLDDVLDCDVETLVDYSYLHLQQPHTGPPTRLRAQHLFHTAGLEAAGPSIAAPVPAAFGGYPLSSAPPPAAPAHVVDEVPALPISGDLPPGCLQWQHEMEKHELWSYTAQQLVSSVQQQRLASYRRPEQRYRGQHQGEYKGDRHSEDEADGERIDGFNGGKQRPSGADVDDSSEDSSGDDSGVCDDRRGKRATGSRARGQSDSADGHGDDDSECGSRGETGRSQRSRGGATRKRNKTKQGRGASSRQSRHKRTKKRKVNQRHVQASDASNSDSDSGSDSSSEEQLERNKKTMHGKTARRRSGKVAAAGKRASGQSVASLLLPSPLYSPSPSSFSTSTAASSASAGSTAASPSIGGGLGGPAAPAIARSASRRPCGGHRSKLPARVVAILRAFFLSHVSHPFPSECEKRELVSRSELSMKQVCDWFTNNRKRYWKPYERKMDRLRCGLVGQAYRSAQTSHHASSRHDRAERSRPPSQLRTTCRCGEDDVAIHDWRQMWD